jgi:hypothetical protein
MIRKMPKIRLPNAHAVRILRLIYERNQISRSDLATESGYSAFLVSKVVRAFAGERVYRRDRFG